MEWKAVDNTNGLRLTDLTHNELSHLQKLKGFPKIRGAASSASDELIAKRNQVGRTYTTGNSFEVVIWINPREQNAVDSALKTAKNNSVW